MVNDEDIRTKVNNYLDLPEPYAGETRVIHYLELLRDVVGFDELKKKVVNPLKGRKVAAYYGCLLLRPSKELGFDNPENPSIMEDFIRALGAEPALYAYRNECCGGYVTLENNGLAQKNVTLSWHRPRMPGRRPSSLPARYACIISTPTPPGRSCRYITSPSFWPRPWA